MRFLLLALVATSCIASAQERANSEPYISPISGQEFEDATAYLWFRVSFEERARLFSKEERDPDWASSMEGLIDAEIKRWARSGVQPVSVECRITLCRIETIWPLSAGRPSGQWINQLYRLDLDHQGESDVEWEEDHIRSILIVRRK
jgi:hypothetical protein